jgi:hypothetical protein
VQEQLQDVPAVITAYIFLYHLAKFLFQRKTYEDLYFALLCLAVILYDGFSIGLYNSTDVSISTLWQRGQLFRSFSLFSLTLRYYEARPGLLMSALFALIVVSMVLRNYDVAGRYGGDEFALLLPFCAQAEAEIVSRRVITSIHAIQLAEHPELKITISLGGTVLGKETECRNEHQNEQ